jgi:Cu+-exporting ATPase
VADEDRARKQKDILTAVESLHGIGIEAAMITGDNRRTADAIARQVEIDRVLGGPF